MATIKDVALKAGVSISSVSKALNNYSDINSETRQAILAVCKELDYVPNQSAKHLATKHSKVIALILSEIKDTDENGNIIYRLLLGAQKQCALKGYELEIIFTDKRKQEKKPLAALCRGHKFCGIVIYGLKLSDPYYHEIETIDIPVVQIDGDPDRDHVSVVCTDNAGAVGDLVTLLWQKGRKHIALINGLKDAHISQIRERCFREALVENGLEVHEEAIVYADFFESRAYELTKTLLGSGQPIDAIFAISDIMAIGVMRAAREMGYQIPQDLSVAGFDGIQHSEFTIPPLTTVFQNFKQMGSLAVDKIILASRGEQVNRVDYVPYTVLVRNSI